MSCIQGELNWCPLNECTELVSIEYNSHSVHSFNGYQLSSPLNKYNSHSVHSFNGHQFSSHSNTTHIQVEYRSSKWVVFGAGIYELVSTWMWVVLKVTQSTNQVTFLMLAFPQLSSWGFDTGGQAGPKPDQLEKKIFELASSNQICDERESNPSRAEVAPGRGSLVILILSLSWRWIGAVRPHLGVD